MSYFLQALATVVDMVLWAYMWVIVARALLSWVNPDPYNPIVRFLYSITEPVMYAIRRRVPLYFSGIDFTPMVLIFGIIFLRNFLVPSLRMMAFQLQ